MGNPHGQNNREMYYYSQLKGMLKAVQAFKIICILEE
jgi:hypothetical protein